MGKKGSKKWETRLRLHLYFFRSTLWVSIPTALILFLLLSYAEGQITIAEGVAFGLLCIPIGLFFDLLYRELARREEYYFYYNQGITRVELWVVSFFLSFSFYLAYKLLLEVWMFVWK
jgi:hypothetical protein